MTDIRPIPNELLGDSFTLLTPGKTGWTEQMIRNVRAERSEAVADHTANKMRENTELTVWFDCVNSSPSADFAVGKRVRYCGEIYEIVERKLFSAGKPHHIKFRARKIGGEYNSDTEVNSL